MKTFIQIEPDFIQTSETHEDGSYTSGIIRRFETKTRQIQDGTEEIKVNTEQVQVGTEQVSIGFDEDEVEVFESQPIFEEQGVFETHPKFIDEEYSPWDELDPELVTWLDIPTFEAEQAEALALSTFKSNRESVIQNKVVNANGHMFHADFWSKTQMSEAIAVLWEDGAQDTDIVQWSLYGTPSGYMTDVTLADLKLARKLAQVNVSNVWGV
jgi:hypothetical protein